MSGPASKTGRRRRLRIAVDIGGTFTDGIAEEIPSARIRVAKRLTTPDDPSRAVGEVVGDLLRQLDGTAAGCVSEVVHGTTLVTNAIIERTGARVALLVTHGTGDVLDIRREIRYDVYDLAIELPQPLVPRRDRHEIDERLDHRGNVIAPLDEDAVRRLLDRLPQQHIEAVAVCLLHAYANDEHERRIAALVETHLPGVSVSLSSLVAREIREYERMSTTTANAYVQPLMARYLNRIEARLSEYGVTAPIRIMLSSGGFTASRAAAAVPIQLLESGPAAGVLSAANTAREAAVENLLTFDMGGTTAKASVVRGGMPAIAHRFEAGRVRRFKKGSGLPILIPSVDLIEIGAGGGSIAHVSALGLLNVGPRSSGAVPGPACYGQGGTDPTVTDADLILGYLDAGFFLGGEMRLRGDLAECALASLADRLGLTPLEAAWGVHNLVNENMAAAARVHIAEKGVDPRRLTMVATGGAGPVHAVAVAEKLGIGRVLCTVAAGAGSCLGLLAAPARADRSWSNVVLLDDIRWPQTRRMLARLRREAAAELRLVGVAVEQIAWTLRAEVRYLGQGNAVEVAVPLERLERQTLPLIRRRFERAYAELYGQAVPGGVPQLITWRLTGATRRRNPPFRLTNQVPSTGAARPGGTRRMFLPARSSFASVPVYDRYALPAKTQLHGPLILQERESTVVVPRPAVVEILPNLTVSIVLA